MVPKTPIIALLVIAIGTGGCGNKTESQDSAQTKKHAGDAKEVYNQIPDSPRLKHAGAAEDPSDQIPDSPRLKHSGDTKDPLDQLRDSPRLK